MSTTQAVRMAKEQIEAIIFERPDLVDRNAAIAEVSTELEGWISLLRGRAYYEAQRHYSLSRIAAIVHVHYDTVRAHVKTYRNVRHMPRFTGRAADPMRLSRSAQERQRVERTP